LAPKFDFHVHTNLSACANPAMTLVAIIRECERVGIEAIGITDHLNAPEHAERNAKILFDIRGLDTKVKVYLGAEVGYSVRLGAHPLDEETKAKLGYQYAIGSHHSLYVREYDLAKLIEEYHRHLLLTCEDPAMDVLGHPYRFLYEEFKTRNWPWIDSMRMVPKRFVRELAQAAVATGTAIEINTTSNLCMKFNPSSYYGEYVEFIAELAGEGVTFSLGSDAHELNEFDTIRLAWDVADRLGIPDERIWRPASPPA
jgi:histidinol phosphatase-like PHP family hydrolase